MADSASYSVLSNSLNLIRSSLKDKVWRGCKVVFLLENGESYHEKELGFLSFRAMEVPGTRFDGEEVGDHGLV